MAQTIPVAELSSETASGRAQMNIMLYWPVYIYHGGSCGLFLASDRSPPAGYPPAGALAGLSIWHHAS